MTNQTGAGHQSPWITQARRNAVRRGGFLAGVFAEYQERFDMADDELARRLGCEPDRISVLALCREPRPAAPQFAIDVRDIATYGGADAGKLAGLVREVSQLRKWTATATASGIAAAARDWEVDEATIEPIDDGQPPAHRADEHEARPSPDDEPGR